MHAEALLLLLDAGDDAQHDAGGWWSRPRALDVRTMAKLLRRREVRLVTITARPDPEGGLRLIYHWDVGSTMLNICLTVPPDGDVPTIADLLPGADWAEREIHDYYGLEFGGRVETPPLMLREGDQAGLFTRTCEVGRDTDPAKDARAAAEPTEGESR
jgi:hypothetical protein